MDVKSVWNEFNTGINGNKALRFYTTEDHTPASRFRCWIGVAMTLLIEDGLTVDGAVARIYRTYRGMNLTDIIKEIMTDHKTKNLKYLQVPKETAMEAFLRPGTKAQNVPMDNLNVTPATLAAVEDQKMEAMNVAPMMMEDQKMEAKNVAPMIDLTDSPKTTSAAAKAPMKIAAPKTAAKRKALMTMEDQKMKAKNVAPMIDLTNSPKTTSAASSRGRSIRSAALKVVSYAMDDSDDEDDN